MTDERGGNPPARTVFIGSGGFGLESLRRLVAEPLIDLVGVVTAPARPAGRRQRPAATVIDEAARAAGIATVLTPGRLRAPESIQAVQDLRPDLVVLADYGQIVPAALLDVRHGALNLHPSLLPRHRGATPVPAAILAGDDETGVTLMQMDTGLDTGPIVAQQAIPLDGTETSPRLEATLAAAAADLLVANLGPWLRGELAARPQPADGGTLTRPLRREDGRLDPNRPAAALERQVRAYQPWPGSFVDSVVGRLIVWVAGVGAGGPAPGVFDATGLGTTDGSLAFVEVQPAGGKRMPWEAFVRGHPSIIGSSVTAGA